MFFNLARQRDPNFPNHYDLGRLVLNTDNGWHQTQDDHCTFVYKGYIDAMSWDLGVLSTMGDQDYLGNFAVFCFDSRTGMTSLFTNCWRGFLIWADANSISNLYQMPYTVWNDSVISVDQDLVMTENKLNIIGEIETDALSRLQALDQVHEIINHRVRDFLATNHLPLKVFCSGGVDSTLVWSYIKQHTQDYELILENRIQWDEFWCRNQRRITTQFWAYRQIHHWCDPCVLSSGAPGDEFMFRSPTTVGLWCRYHDIDVFDLISDPEILHHHYFMQEKHQKLFAEQQKDPQLDKIMQLPPGEFVWYLCNIIVNDCQHWHLGNTLTFTPLRDLRIFQTLLRMPQQDLISQMLNSDVSRELISRNDQDLLLVMSDIKNVGESLANMASLISR